MCHTRTQNHTATSSGCGVRTHSSFHGSESPNPSRNSCSNSSINCFAFRQTNLGILLVRHAVPPLCSQHCAWNSEPRLVLPISILLQKSTALSDTSDSRCHLERRSAQPSPGSPASVSKPLWFPSVQTVRVCSELLLLVVLGVCWSMILVNLHCSSGQVYKQALMC